MYLLFLSLLGCQSAEPKLGYTNPRNPQEAEVFALINKADRYIDCSIYIIVRDPDSPSGYRQEKPDELVLFYDLGIRETEVWKNNAESGPFAELVKPHRAPLLFEFEQIQDYLEKERHKDLLVLRFNKLILMDESTDDYVALAQEQTRNLGYARIVILGAGGLGTWKLYDSAE